MKARIKIARIDKFTPVLNFLFLLFFFIIRGALHYFVALQRTHTQPMRIIV